jgi:hypothetical protein
MTLEECQKTVLIVKLAELAQSLGVPTGQYLHVLSEDAGSQLASS